MFFFSSKEFYLLGHNAVQSVEITGVISQKTELCITTAVRTSNPTSLVSPGKCTFSCTSAFFHILYAFIIHSHSVIPHSILEN
jgi:hypothetical protein